jgi:hypothetical protein
VLGDGGAGKGEGAGQFPDRVVALPEGLQDPPAHRVGQRLEDGVEVGTGCRRAAGCGGSGGPGGRDPAGAIGKLHLTNVRPEASVRKTVLPAGR